MKCKYGVGSNSRVSQEGCIHPNWINEYDIACHPRKPHKPKRTITVKAWAYFYMGTEVGTGKIKEFMGVTLTGKPNSYLKEMPCTITIDRKYLRGGK